MKITELVTPNWHVILIHYPLGLLSVGILIEFFSFLWRSSSVRTAARWMILLGTLALIPAITSGLFAFREALGSSPDATWTDIKASGSFFSPDQWAVFRHHILFNAWGTGAMALAVVTFLGSSDRWRRTLYFPLLLVLLGGYGLLACGAWNGGEGVFRYGTGVAGTKGVVTTDASYLAQNGHAMEGKVEGVIPPIQLHLLLAGVTVAIALAGLGLSIRGLSQGDQVDEWYHMQQLRRQEEHDPNFGEQYQSQEAGVVPLSPDQAHGLEMRDNVEPFASEARVINPAPTPSARWWLVGALIALGAVAAGLWTSGIFDNPRPVAALRNSLISSWHDVNGRRMVAHFIGGSSIIVLALVMALIGRFAKRSKTLLSIFAVLMLAVIAGQFWLGILMLYDGSEGSLKAMDGGGIGTSTPAAHVASAG